MGRESVVLGESFATPSSVVAICIAGPVRHSLANRFVDTPGRRLTSHKIVKTWPDQSHRFEELPNLKIQLQVDPGLKKDLLPNPFDQMQTLVTGRVFVGHQIVGLPAVQ